MEYLLKTLPVLEAAKASAVNKDQYAHSPSFLLRLLTPRSSLRPHRRLHDFCRFGGTVVLARSSRGARVTQRGRALMPLGCVSHQLRYTVCVPSVASGLTSLFESILCALASCFSSLGKKAVERAAVCRGVELFTEHDGMGPRH
jgi:hypothetical protein